MPFRFSRRINLGNGFHINLSKSGIGFSQKVGPLTLGSKRTTVNLPGTGASFYVNNQKKGYQANSENSQIAPVADPANISPYSPAVSPTGTTKAGPIAWLIMISVFICIMCAIFGAFGSLINSLNPTPTLVVAHPLIFPISNITPLATDPISDATQTDVPQRTAIPTPTFRPYPTTSLMDLATEGISTLQADFTTYPTQPKRIIQPTQPKRIIQPTAKPSTGGATAICRDGTLSYSQSRSGTCSHHGGVSQWLQ